MSDALPPITPETLAEMAVDPRAPQPARRWPMDWVSATPAEDDGRYLPWPEHGAIYVRQYDGGRQIGTDQYACSCGLTPDGQDTPEGRRAAREAVELHVRQVDWDAKLARYHDPLDAEFPTFEAWKLGPRPGTPPRPDPDDPSNYDVWDADNRAGLNVYGPEDGGDGSVEVQVAEPHGACIGVTLQPADRRRLIEILNRNLPEGN